MPSSTWQHPTANISLLPHQRPPLNNERVIDFLGLYRLWFHVKFHFRIRMQEVKIPSLLLST